MASPAYGGGFYASWTKIRLHHYGAHTAYGARAVLKPSGWREVGKFPTRKEAITAARKAAEEHLQKYFAPK